MKKMKFIGLCLSLLAPFSSFNAYGDHYKYDYIIVGNGSAGSILARKLSDDLKTKVLVVEAGINQDNDPAVLDFGQAAFFEDLWNLTFDPYYAETYALEVIAPLNSTIYSEGRGWGGSSKHNYFVAVRGTPPIWDGWASISGNPAWSYNNMLPLMIALENYNPCMTTANASQRGVGGPISITQLTAVDLGPLSAALELGLATGGVGTIADYNDPTIPSSTGLLYMGLSPLQGFITSPAPCTPGIRSFSSREFLTPDVVTPDGRGVGKRLLSIQSNCHVSRLIMDGTKAKGIEFVYGTKGNKVGKAYGKKIILCAGAINTPAILMRSGIGDPAILGPLGIDVKIANPNVGANLQNQYGAYAVTSLTTTLAFGEVFTNASGLTGNYAYPNDTARRYQLAFLPGATSTTLATFLLEPKSVGSIKIVSTDPLVQPLISLNLYSDVPASSPNFATPWLQNGSDANLMATALMEVGNAVGTANMIAPPPSAYVGTPDMVAAAMYAYAISPDGLVAESHIVGTTRMAQSIATGVVDGNLNVFGAENLMIADIGVLPNSIDGNLCYGAYMIAFRLATMLGVPIPPAL